MTTSDCDFSHAYQSQVYRPCVIHILPQFSLISFGSWYSGIWHIDHICFAIWIWDWFHEYVSFSVSLSFMLYFFLQYTFDQIKAISLRSKEQTFFSRSLYFYRCLLDAGVSFQQTNAYYRVGGFLIRRKSIILDKESQKGIRWANLQSGPLHVFLPIDFTGAV